MKRFLLKFKPLVVRLFGEHGYLVLRSKIAPLLEPTPPAALELPDPDHADFYAERHEENLTFSIVVPVYNTPEAFLHQCVQSVMDQIYPHWELILVDDASVAPHVRPILEQAAAKDDRIKTIFRSENGNISAATNSGLEAATGRYFTVLDHDDTLSPAALYWMVDALHNNPEAEYLYSDEDKTNTGGKQFFGAFLKPGWSPELTLQCMYSCHMSVYDRKKAQSIGGFRSDFDGAQDFDFMLRYLLAFDRVQHVNKVLYHWRQWEESTALDLDAKPEAFHRQRRALEEYLDAKNEAYTIEDHPLLKGHHKVTFLPRQRDKVSIIIPTANGSLSINGRDEDHADAVVASIVETSTYDNYEIVLVHNGDLRAQQTAQFEANPRVRLVHYEAPGPFNLANKINQGAAAATGDYILIMNDDIRVITENWMERMLGMAQRPGVGVVGAKLLFPDNSVQHSGVWIRGNVPGHIDYQSTRDAVGYDLSGVSNRNCVAVTGACHLSSREIWQDLGGYDPQFALNYNDVDYCLRLHEKGLRAVCLGDVELYHYEGVSKEGGASTSTYEIELFLDTWKARLPYDPYLPANLV